MAKRFGAASICGLGVMVLTVGAAAPDGVPGTASFDRLPTGVLAQMFDSTMATGYPSLAWTAAPGTVRTVTVAFNGGTPQAWALIEQTANEWTANGGKLKLSFRTNAGAWRTWATTDLTPKADIRIGFFTDPDRRGYWSAVGTLARRIYPNAPTMNYGVLGTSLASYDPVNKPQQWRLSYAHSVILHEFGHALSLNHEHFHPQCQQDLKVADAIASLQQPPNNWTLDQARFNMDGPYYFSLMAAQTGGVAPVQTPGSDRSSVMLYSFDDGFYKSGAASPCRPAGVVTAGGVLRYAIQLSAQDKAYYAMVYGTGA